MATSTKTRKSDAARDNNLGMMSQRPLTKRVESDEEFPAPDDVLVVLDEVGEFQFQGLMECGITPFFLLSKRLKNGQLSDILHTRSEGRVYFRDLPAGTKRGKRIIATRRTAAGATDDDTEAAKKPKVTLYSPPASKTVPAKPKTKPVTSATPAEVTDLPKRRGRPKGSKNKEKRRAS